MHIAGRHAHKVAELPPWIPLRMRSPPLRPADCLSGLRVAGSCLWTTPTPSSPPLCASMRQCASNGSGRPPAIRSARRWSLLAVAPARKYRLAPPIPGAGARLAAGFAGVRGRKHATTSCCCLLATRGVPPIYAHLHFPPSHAGPTPIPRRAFPAPFQHATMRRPGAPPKRPLLQVRQDRGTKPPTRDLRPIHRRHLVDRDRQTMDALEMAAVIAQPQKPAFPVNRRWFAGPYVRK